MDLLEYVCKNILIKDHNEKAIRRDGLTTLFSLSNPQHVLKEGVGVKHVFFNSTFGQPIMNKSANILIAAIGKYDISMYHHYDPFSFFKEYKFTTELKFEGEKFHRMNIPLVLEIIFSYCNYPSLLEAMCTCKTWFNIINRDNFWREYYFSYRRNSIRIQKRKLQLEVFRIRKRLLDLRKLVKETGPIFSVYHRRDEQQCLNELQNNTDLIATSHRNLVRETRILSRDFKNVNFKWYVYLYALNSRNSTFSTHLNVMNLNGSKIYHPYYVLHSIGSIIVDVDMALLLCKQKGLMDNILKYLYGAMTIFEQNLAARIYVFLSEFVGKSEEIRNICLSKEVVKMMFYLFLYSTDLFFVKSYVHEESNIYLRDFFNLKEKVLQRQLRDGDNPYKVRVLPREIDIGRNNTKPEKYNYLVRCVSVPKSFFCTLYKNESNIGRNVLEIMKHVPFFELFKHKFSIYTLHISLCKYLYDLPYSNPKVMKEIVKEKEIVCKFVIKMIVHNACDHEEVDEESFLKFFLSLLKNEACNKHLVSTYTKELLALLQLSFNKSFLQVKIVTLQILVFLKEFQKFLFSSMLNYAKRKDEDVINKDYDDRKDVIKKLKYLQKVGSNSFDSSISFDSIQLVDLFSLKENKVLKEGKAHQDDAETLVKSANETKKKWKSLLEQKTYNSSVVKNLKNEEKKLRERSKVFYRKCVDFYLNAIFSVPVHSFKVRSEIFCELSKCCKECGDIEDSILYSSISIRLSPKEDIDVNVKAEIIRIEECLKIEDYLCFANLHMSRLLSKLKLDSKELFTIYNKEDLRSTLSSEQIRIAESYKVLVDNLPIDILQKRYGCQHNLESLKNACKEGIEKYKKIEKKNDQHFKVIDELNTSLKQINSLLNKFKPPIPYIGKLTNPIFKYVVQNTQQNPPPQQQQQRVYQPQVIGCNIS